MPLKVQTWGPRDATSFWTSYSRIMAGCCGWNGCCCSIGCCCCCCGPPWSILFPPSKGFPNRLERKAAWKQSQNNEQRFTAGETQRLSGVNIVVYWPERVDDFKSFFSDTHSWLWLSRTSNECLKDELCNLSEISTTSRKVTVQSMFSNAA